MPRYIQRSSRKLSAGSVIRKETLKTGSFFFTCHNTALLEDLQKEEIVLCEKDASGCTEVFRLADVKNVRRGENFFRAYLNGSYGALPNIG